MRYAPEPSQRTPSESSQSALALFFALAEKWSLTTDQQIRLLGSPPDRRSSNGRRKGA